MELIIVNLDKKIYKVQYTLHDSWLIISHLSDSLAVLRKMCNSNTNVHM